MRIFAFVLLAAIAPRPAAADGALARNYAGARLLFLPSATQGAAVPAVGAAGAVATQPADAAKDLAAAKAELEASRTDKTDRGLVGLAEWGRWNSVVYPNQTFGVEILNGIEYSQITR